MSRSKRFVFPLGLGVVALLSGRGLPALAQQQPPPAAWVARYNGPQGWYDSASAVVVDGSGNVYVTGVSGFYRLIPTPTGGLRDHQI